MNGLEDKVVRGSSGEYLLEYEECALHLISSHKMSDGGTIYIYKVVFDPEFTYKTGFIYVNEYDLGRISRSVKYFRAPEEAYRVALSLYKESV